MDLTQRIVNSSTMRVADEMAVRSPAFADDDPTPPDDLSFTCSLFILSAFIFIRCTFAELAKVPVSVVS
jgi:hypothetical protein